VNSTLSNSTALKAILHQDAATCKWFVISQAATATGGRASVAPYNDVNIPLYKRLGVFPQDYDSILISSLALSVRPENIMVHENIITFGDLLRLNERKIRRIRNLGKNSYDELIERIFIN